AFCRSFSTWVPTCRKTSARPPTCTLTVASEIEYAGEIRLTRSRTVSSEPVMRARIIARVPSVLLSGGAWPRLQYEATSATPGSAASCSVSCAPRAATADESTVPCVAVTRSTRFGLPVWKVSFSAVAARLDSEFGSSKPPEERCCATLPPNEPATATNTSASAKIHRRHRTVNRPNRSISASSLRALVRRPASRLPVVTYLNSLSVGKLARTRERRQPRTRPEVQGSVSGGGPAPQHPGDVDLGPDHAPTVQDQRRLEPAQQGQHRDVLGQDVRPPGGDPPVVRRPCQDLQQRGSQAAAVVAVDHRQGRLGDGRFVPLTDA